MSPFLSLLLLALGIGAQAHTIVVQIGIDGVMQPEWDYLRLPELTLVSINIPSGLPVLAS